MKSRKRGGLSPLEGCKIQPAMGVVAPGEKKNIYIYLLVDASRIGHELGRSGVRIWAGARNVSLLQNSPDWFLGQPSLLFSEYRGCFAGGRAAGALS